MAQASFNRAIPPITETKTVVVVEGVPATLAVYMTAEEANALLNFIARHEAHPVVDKVFDTIYDAGYPFKS